ncbi:MAG: hypothetical protein HQK96_07690 [Nitrospirae bacterium]|nr:hypothetical protein [Nitrospirota bacterium]
MGIRQFEFSFYSTKKDSENKLSPLGYNFSVSLEKVTLTEDKIIQGLREISVKHAEDIFFRFSPPLVVQLANIFGDDFIKHDESGAEIRIGGSEKVES